MSVVKKVAEERIHASNGPRLPEETSAKRNVIHTRTDFFVPAGDDDISAKSVLVIVHQLLKNGSRRIYRGRSAIQLTASTGQI
jgi:hypothetical protein